MSEKKLQNILNEGEGKFVEFKESPKNLDKEICAFANAGGGTIYIGIRDNNKIKPIRLTNKLKSQLQDITRSCEPVVEIQIKQIESIIAIIVFESDSKPVKTVSGFYMRFGANSQKLNRDEIFEFAIQEGTIKFDTQIYTDAVAKELLSVRKVERFREKSQLAKELDNINFLKNISCLINKNGKCYLTYGGILLFGKRPQDIFPHATLTLLHMKDPATILEQRIITGTLFDQVEDGIAIIQRILISRPKIEKLQREDILELPEFVLRELLVNALIHRNYFESAADVMIKILPDRLEFSNPGKPSSNIPLDLLYGHSFRRNRVLADVFYRARYIERAGTGLLRTRQILSKNNLPALKIKEEGTFFVALLPRPKDLDHSDLFNNRQRECFNLPDEFYPFSTIEYANYFKISVRSARLDIKGLIKLKKLKMIKKGRNIKYYVTG